MKLSLERKIVLGFTAAVAVLTLVTIAAWWNMVRFKGTLYWVEHTREVISQLEETASELLAMQTSTRGFVITGTEEVLVPFTAGSAALSTSIAELRKLVADNPLQLREVETLENLADKARTIMEGRITARRQRGADAATDTEQYLEGQRTVEEFRGVVRSMISRERLLLDDRMRRAEAFGRWTVFTIVGATLLAAGFVIAAGRIVHRDLTRRQEAESALKESFARVEDLYNRAPCGYHSLDTSGKFVAINDTALQWLGYSREEVVGHMNFADILTPESAAQFRTRFAHFKSNGSVENVEYDWVRKDGGTLPVLLNATAIYDSAGEYVASRATVFDATARRRVEAERDRFFSLSRDLLCIASTEGRFLRVNPAWSETLHHGSEELIARPFIDFIHEDDVARTLAEIRRLAEGHETIGFENRFRCKDGSYRWLSWNARSTPADKLIFASAHDITDRRAADERIRKLHFDLEARARQLEAANRELESFTYSVSHDLRAPLRHIDGFASLLTKRANDSLDAEGQRYVGTISKSAKRMGALIDDLLAFSRIGRVELERERVEQDALVAEVIANGRFERNGTPIQWKIAPLPNVDGDKATLRQVWANLIENAVKYSSKETAPCIEIGSHVDSTTREHIFFVRDNGVGFDMAYADKLFGVFQRLHSASDFDGTGIGLANVRRIVSRHGGRTWAESKPGAGATFYFSLPLPGGSSAHLT